MSNCVTIHNIVAIPLDRISAPRLFADIDRVQALEKHPSWDNYKDNTIWWFLSRDNVWMEDGHVLIDFGGARSGHTWRDLEATRRVLLDYITVEEQMGANLSMSDESDGFSSTYTRRMDFTKGS